MSSKLIAGNATNGSSLSADTTGILEIQTGSTPTTAITVDASQNVGIGTSSPGAKLDIQGSALRLNLQSSNNGANATWKYVGKNSGGTAVNYEQGINIAADNAFELYDNINSALASRYVSGASGYWAWLTNAAERMRIDSSGNLLVGTTTSYGLTTLNVGATGTFALVLNSPNTSGTYYLQSFRAATTVVGSITSNGSSTSYNTSSDYRLKENIAPMSGALGVVQQLKPCTYTWKSDGTNGQGFIAHELQEVVPDCVTGEKDAVDEEGNPKYQGIDTSFLVATLTAAIQELNAKVDAQAAEIKALKGTA